MRLFRAALALAVPASLIAAAPSDAKGCIRGALAGGVVGHVAGHHALAGAAAGCVAGHMYYKHKARHAYVAPVPHHR